MLAGLHILQKHSIQLYSAAAVSQVTVQKEGLEDMAGVAGYGGSGGKGPHSGDGGDGGNADGGKGGNGGRGGDATTLCVLIAPNIYQEDSW